MDGKSTVTRAFLLRGAVASALLLISGCGDSRNAQNCDDYDENLVRSNVLKKLKEKHPQLTFEIKEVTFSPEGKFPFWHVEANTYSAGEKLMVFAMHYCEGSVELTALNPYQP